MEKQLHSFQIIVQLDIRVTGSSNCSISLSAFGNLTGGGGINVTAAQFYFLLEFTCYEIWLWLTLVNRITWKQVFFK